MRNAIIGLMMGALLAGSALGQQSDRQSTPKAPRERAEEQDHENSTDSIRARLEISIERGEEQLARNRAALERLNDGESPASVLRAMRREWPRAREADERRPEQPAHGDRPREESPRERMEEIRVFISEHIPELDKKMHLLAEQDGTIADRIMGRLAPMVEEVMRAYDEDRAFGRLKLEEMRSGLGFVEAMRVYREAIGSESSTEQTRATATEQLREAAEARFDAQMRVREYEITMLTERLLAMSRTLSKMRSDRDDEIEQMIGAADELGKPRRPGRREQAGSEKVSGDD